MASAEDYKKISDQLREQVALEKQAKNARDAAFAQSELYYNNERLINELLSSRTGKLMPEEERLLKEAQDENKKITKELETQNTLIGSKNKLLLGTNNQLKLGWQYLMQSDKAIRQTILGLGMSGTKAEGMRTSFEGSARAVAKMGGGLTDIQNIMTGYADETGRARVLSSQMVEDITAIGKGTGIGIEQATKLGAQFELMGFDAKKTVDYVQGIVDTSERMGVNTTKVLKNVNDNFKKLNTYTFQQGSKGIAQMAMYAEKFKINIDDALNAAAVSKTLEGAIDLTAKLQVMGGEFAKTDPFEMLFLSRNDPAKYTQKISEMTRGIVTFRKNADGTFEKFISPADRDRLAAVGKSLGISAEEITQIAQRRAEMDKMTQQLAGAGLTGREKELVEGAAIFNAKTGRFEVQLAGRMKDISTLTKDQAESFVKEKVTLDKRAEAAQDFETAFKATLEELKASLLPLLKGINSVLAFVRPIVSGFAKGVEKIFNNDFGKWVGMFFAGAVLINKAFSFIAGRGILEKMAEARGGGGAVGGFLRRRGIGKAAETAAETLPAAGKGVSGLAQKRILEGQGAKMTGLGKAGAGIGAGLGAAALGVGAGIGAAAAGISLLANAMSKLTPEQAKTLSSVVKSLGWFVIGGAAAAAAIMVFGGASTVASVGLLAFGGAVALVGIGIGAAAAGIGLMGSGLAKLATAAKGSGKDMLMLGAGITAMGAGLALFTVGSLGLIAFSVTLNKIAKHADAIAQVGDSFKQINAVMHGTKEDFMAVESAVNAISGMNVKGGTAFAQLASILKTPLKVEFADKNVQLANDITLNIDGQKFMQKVFKAHTSVKFQEELRTQSINQ